jgi:hypothetical protein
LLVSLDGIIARLVALQLRRRRALGTPRNDAYTSIHPLLGAEVRSVRAGTVLWQADRLKSVTILLSNQPILPPGPLSAILQDLLIRSGKLPCPTQIRVTSARMHPSHPRPGSADGLKPRSADWLLSSRQWHLTVITALLCTSLHDFNGRCRNIWL